MADKRVFLLDGMALAYRAHFALMRSPITNSKGMNTSAIYGFANTLISIITSENPTHLAVSFDTSALTERHKIYPEYKAQRQEMPEELSIALPLIKKLCEAMRIPLLIMDGYEADDIIGTYARLFDEAGDAETFMVTPDKDFAQLVTKTTSMWKPGRKGSEKEVLGYEQILENWEVSDPKQVIDILGLWGDASDNIPGVPGIGEKTAKKLVGLYESVEGLIDNVEQLKGKQKENVTTYREQALLSKRLATIDRFVPVEHSVDDLVKQEFNEEELKELFTEWEFRTLSKRLFGEVPAMTTTPTTVDESAEVGKTIKDFDKKYVLLQKEGFAEFFEKVSKEGSFCFDLETTSLNRFEAEILGIAFSWNEHTGYYLPLNSNLESCREPLEKLFSNQAHKIGHNLKYDLSVLLNHGIHVNGPFIDTMLIHALCYPGQKHSMDALAESLLGYSTIKLTDLVEEHSGGDADDLFAYAKKTKGKDLDVRSIPQEKLADYACEDADVTWQLAKKLLPVLSDFGMENLYVEIEAKLLPVLTEIEHTGVSISEEKLSEIGVKLGKKIETLTAEIQKAAGKEFNLNSPKQLGEILFGEMQLVEKPKKTKTGQFVTNEQTLSALAPKHKIVANILEYRESTKLKGTYVDALPNHVEKKTGRIHTQLHQLQTSTGRLASSDPNLQNIPIRSETGRSIRGAFVPCGAEFKLLAVDYSQIELRVMAALSGDQSMIEAFKANEDIHTATSAKVFGVTPLEVTREMRSTAKMVNFGIIYGISAFGLSQRLGTISRSEAGEIIEAYFKQYPAVKEFMQNTVDEAKEKGYAETLCGRRHYYPDLKSSNATVRNNAERAAINMPIQGTAADMIKIAMVNVQQFLKQKQAKTKLLLQVHDELLFDLHKDEEKIIPEIVRIMEQALTLPHSVPAKVEFGIGENWLEAH